MHGQAGLASALSAWRARASGAGLEAAATTAKRYNFVNTCNYLLSWRCRKVHSSGRVMQQHSSSQSELAARQLDLLLEQLFGAPCVAPCAREAVECSATTFAKPRGVHLGACRSGDKGNERCPQRRVDVRARRARHPAASAFPARQGEPRRDLALAEVANGCLWAAQPRVGAAGPAQRPQGRRERRRRAPGRPLPDHDGSRT